MRSADVTPASLSKSSVTVSNAPRSTLAATNRSTNAETRASFGLVFWDLAMLASPRPKTSPNQEITIAMLPRQSGLRPTRCPNAMQLTRFCGFLLYLRGNLRTISLPDGRAYLLEQGIE